MIGVFEQLEKQALLEVQASIGFGLCLVCRLWLMVRDPLTLRCGILRPKSLSILWS